MLLTVIGLLVFVAASVFVWDYAEHLRQYRKDPAPHLSYRFLFRGLDAFDPRNYNDRGRRLLRWMWLGVGLQLLAGIILMLS